MIMITIIIGIRIIVKNNQEMDNKNNDDDNSIEYNYDNNDYDFFNNLR